MEVTHKKNISKLKYRNKKKVYRKIKPFKNFILFLIFKLFLGLNFALQFIFVFTKKRYKFLLILSTAFILSYFIFLGFTNILKLNNNTLPEVIQIDIPNKSVSNLVFQKINNTLKIAIKKKQSRKLFLEKVDLILNSFDEIDQYWIRLGLDKKLQVNASLQIPMLLLTTKNSIKFIISNNSKIIGKCTNCDKYLGLMNLNTPEIAIQWKSKIYFTKDQNSNTKLFSSGQIIPNFNWLINETKLINVNFQDLNLKYYLNNISWKSKIGFVIQLKPYAEKNDNVTIQLGTNNLIEKINNCKTLLNDLNKKNIYPKNINLDYNDKASFTE